MVARSTILPSRAVTAPFGRTQESGAAIDECRFAWRVPDAALTRGLGPRARASARPPRRRPLLRSAERQCCSTTGRGEVTLSTRVDCSIVGPMHRCHARDESGGGSPERSSIRAASWVLLSERATLSCSGRPVPAPGYTQSPGATAPVRSAKQRRASTRLSPFVEHSLPYSHKAADSQEMPAMQTSRQAHQCQASCRLPSGKKTPGPSRCAV